MKRHLSGRALVFIALALFIIASAAHIACGDFSKAIDVLPDERRYLEIARSLFTGNGLIIRGEASGFQKILYPLSLFPALLFEHGADQVRAIGVLSSLYACSTVFPVLAIARKIFESPYAVIASMVLALITPDLMYSMTFMSESLFMPLALWLVYLCWHCFEARGHRALFLSAAAGLLCYIVYLCKEVALMFLFAYAAWFIVALVRKRRTAAASLGSLGVFAAGFFVPFIIMKLTLFAGLQNSYSQFSFDILQSPYTVLFGLYSLVTDGLYITVGFGIFPVLFLACTYRDFTRKFRDVLFFCFASLAVGLLVIVFTISMREDVGHVALRQHLRYVAPLALPLLMLFMKQCAQFDPATIRHSPRRRGIYLAVTVCFCSLVAGFFGTANLQQGFDFSQFHLLRFLSGELAPLDQSYFDANRATLIPIDASDGNLLVINPLDWALRALIIAFTAIGMALLISRRYDIRKGAGIILCALIAAGMMLNTIALYGYCKGAYEVEHDDVDEICEISDQLESINDSSDIVIVLDEDNTRANNLIDTYVQDGAGRYRYITVDSFNRILGAINAVSGATDGSLTTMSDISFTIPDYVLVNTDQEVDFGNLTVDDISFGYEDPWFELYRIRS